MFKDTLLINELIFWSFFITSNSVFYLINYFLHHQESSFFPYINQFITTRKLGITACPNQDFFRYSVEWSILVLTSRFINLTPFVLVISSYYFLILFFNLYQYLFRTIYQSEPNFYSDWKLLKNGIAIIWHESKWKIGLAIVSLYLIFSSVHFSIDYFLSYSLNASINAYFYGVSIIWILTVIRSIQKHGFYKDYPNDTFIRNHFTIIEIIENVKRSLANQKMAKKKVGKKFFNARKNISFELKEPSPNIHFLFIESYGSYYFHENSLKKESQNTLDLFKDAISESGWSMVSNFSESPITGGQSWLTYSTVLSGLRMSENTSFENYLHDPNFSESNMLLKLLQKQGYTNYNINPISPIKGINVPYEHLRSFYSIDRWILKDVMNYEGEVYGFGACPPDQYAMNFSMELIKKEQKSPYTFFYLTKNSHSPFIPPKLVDNWKDLNSQNGGHHVHKGFLKHPTIKDYGKAISYEFDNLERFIQDHGQENDIFLLIGDHQPPILSNPDIFGYETPVHIVSKNPTFLDHFKEYGFKNELMDCKNPIKHEAMYSIFLRSFIKSYGTSNSTLPDYEPEGIKL